MDGISNTVHPGSVSETPSTLWVAETAVAASCRGSPERRRAQAAPRLLPLHLGTSEKRPMASSHLHASTAGVIAGL